MADTRTSPTNIKIQFRGKPLMAKSGAPPLGESPKPDNDFEAEDALRTHVRANEIAGKPDLMKRVQTKAKQQMAGLSAIAQGVKRGAISNEQADKVRAKWGKPTKQQGSE